MMLVSNNFPASASPGVAPLVTVWGAVSSLETVITSPFDTVKVAGVYEGLPGVYAPEGIDSVGPPAVAVEVALPPAVLFEEAPLEPLDPFAAPPAGV